jgi:hypothetical protein
MSTTGEMKEEWLSRRSIWRGSSARRTWRPREIYDELQANTDKEAVSVILQPGGPLLTRGRWPKKGR